MIYIDCGYYAGIALKQYKKDGIVDDSWTIYAFEPNPELNYPGPKLIRKAVWIKEGEMTFNVGGRHDAGHLNGIAGGGEEKQITVETMDFSEFVGELPDDYIICSMDIEGAEWQVLRKMIHDGTMSKINLLDVEMHHRISSEYYKEEAEELVKKIEDLGVTVSLKVEL